MKIVFMGSPDFAVKTLELCVLNHEVIGVFTQPDRPKGRGKQLAKQPVKIAAEAHNIPVYQPERIKREEWVEKLRELAPDCIVVVAYGQILSKEILEIPKYGCINVHASLLPKYRGAAPINWAVADGESVSGVTTMKMDVGLDTGDMLLKGEIEIGKEMTAGELHDELAVIGAELLLDTLHDLEEGTLEGELQNEEQATYASMLNKEISKIDWKMTAHEIECRIRGFNPWPVAHCIMEEKTLKVFKAETMSSEALNVEDAAFLKGASPGTVVKVNKDSVVVKAESGYLKLLEIQWGNKKRMDVGSFLLGHAIEVGTVLI